ncbi:PucR family transcriptional regulator [Alicyclobacillus fastidiosus]|uniref:PucR family transcriptional regulator ligand-binding domain-containing protein n=1 Tax=Alicyclobacillus fastidiosus TaxID=392011 RepID=A0ABV5AC32_9BACL|nr:PucR family transcriptional regulator [Alicyclobacillus fastidiosus]WEH07669.1 PucR family transcriptional regulator ligand-binding domain-containing protein [Alicyclobacillus fastidiosus]
MHLTVRNVMDLEVMNAARVLTDSALLDQRAVKSVSVIEIPVEDFVREHEFVLTTGVGCSENPRLALEFVSDVINCGAAALAIATGRHILEIPDEVVSLAAKHQFPLIEVPWETRFADITSDVLAALNNTRESILKESEEIQGQLLSLILNSSDLADIANFIYDKLTYPILIIDRQGKLIARSNHSESLYTEWKQSDKFRFHPFHVTSDRDFPASNQQLVHRVGTHRFLKVSIRSSSEVLGYFITSIPRGMPLNTFFPIEKAYILEHASTAAALTFLRSHMIQSTESRLRTNFIWNLANGEIRSWDVILSQAESFGYNIAESHVCLIAHIENLQRVFHQSVRDVSFDNWVETTLTQLEECVRDAGEADHYNLLVTYHDDELIIFYGRPEDGGPDTPLNALIDILEACISERIEGLLFSWGIGNFHEGADAFQQSYTQARLAIDLGYRKKGRGQRTHYTEVSLNEAFVRLADDPEMQNVTDSVLGRLFEYDRMKSMDLVETLRTYLRNQCNVSQTSRDMNIHRQTLIYRIHKIESLTNRSLVDPDDLFLLDLSLRLSSVASPKSTVGS